MKHLRVITERSAGVSNRLLKYVIQLDESSRKNLIKISKGDLEKRTSDLLYLLSQYEEFKLFESESAKISLNQEQIAKLLGCARESLNRTLKRLEKTEAIRIRNNHIYVINRIALAQKSAAYFTIEKKRKRLAKFLMEFSFGSLLI